MLLGIFAFFVVLTLAAMRVPLRFAMPFALVPFCISAVLAYRSWTKPEREFRVTGITPGMIHEAKSEARGHLFAGAFASMLGIALVFHFRRKGVRIWIEM